ncbi:MAG TPA: acetate--CoA ligase [Desulfotomaculum sp.]|nr:acetate--CoA ligase [Desulfotomaculum sp.]
MAYDHKIYRALPGEHNLTDYTEACEELRFESVERQFSWHSTGRLNIAYEAVDRNVMEKNMGDSIALYFSDGAKDIRYTFAQIKDLSDKFAAVLRKCGIKKGDRVGVFLPRSPELYISFIGIFKTGAVAVPLFEAFMEEAVKDRLGDSGAVAVITVTELLERIPREALPGLKHLFVVNESPDHPNVIHWWPEVEKSDALPIEWVDREDPMFILYASGADGRAKGLVHVHGAMVGYLITGQWVHDLKKDDVYWCTADPGWITGIVYGFLTPWIMGVPVVVRGGRFNAGDWCATLADYGVSVWYSAPTAFRMIMSGGEELLKKYDLGRLRHILSVGEPLTEEVLEWSLANLNQPIYDTWWMSETGMNMICNYRCLDIKLGSIGRPFPGIGAAVVDDQGSILPPGQIGNLAIRAGWPAMARDVWNDHEKYEEYFKIKPWFISGDAAYMDKDGWFYFQGRLDGVINTAGERVGPFEVEAKLEEHPAVDRAGVVGKPDQLRGEIVKAYIALREGVIWSRELHDQLRNTVKTGLAAHAAPREIEVVAAIPLTREGKVDRRVLKEWVLGLNTGQPK